MSPWRAFPLTLASLAIQFYVQAISIISFGEFVVYMLQLFFVGCRHQGAQWPLLAGKLTRGQQ
jgi:hypothetical protein